MLIRMCDSVSVEVYTSSIVDLFIIIYVN